MPEQFKVYALYNPNSTRWYNWRIKMWEDKLNHDCLTGHSECQTTYNMFSKSNSDVEIKKFEVRPV